MAWMVWKSEHATGHAGMDHGHAQLMRLIDQLADAMESNKPKEYCSHTLEQFIAQTSQHFAVEEQLMDQYRWPQAKAHKNLHAALLKDVLAFKSSYDAGDTTEFVTLLVILESWLERDILGADKALAEFVAAADSDQAQGGSAKTPRR